MAEQKQSPRTSIECFCSSNPQGLFAMIFHDFGSNCFSSWSLHTFYFYYQSSSGCTVWRPQKCTAHIHLMLLLLYMLSMIWVLIASVPGLCIPFSLSIRVLVVVPCGRPRQSPRTSIECFCSSNPQGLFAIIFMIWVLIASVPGRCILFYF